jgi:hypothetical protein
MRNFKKNEMNISKSVWTLSCSMFGYIHEGVSCRDENDENDVITGGLYSFSDAMEMLREYLNDNENCTNEVLSDKSCVFEIRLEDLKINSYSFITYFEIKGTEILKLRKAGIKF